MNNLMTLDEAISHCIDVAAGNTAQGKCPSYAAEHLQLAAWLTELKERREKDNK